MKMITPPTRITLHRPPRAMALMAGIMMFVLIGAAVLAMTMAFTTEVHRTRDAVAGPQLRQFLLAGALLATRELQQHGPADRELPLQFPLPDASGSLHIAPSKNGIASVRITARLHDARSLQQLTFSQDAQGAWRLQQAALQ